MSCDYRGRIWFLLVVWASVMSCSDPIEPPETAPVPVAVSVMLEGGIPLDSAWVGIEAYAETSCAGVPAASLAGYTDARGEYSGVLVGEQEIACVASRANGGVESGIEPGLESQQAVASPPEDTIRLNVTLTCPPPEPTSSFEEDFGCWLPFIFGSGSKALRSTERASAGATSVHLVVSGTDEGNEGVVLLRAFQVEPDRPHQIEISYRLATNKSDDSVNHDSFLLGITHRPPQGPQDGTLSYTIRNGRSDFEWVWLEKEHVVEATANPDGVLYVWLGAILNWGGEHHYFLDDLSVTLIPL